MNILFDDINIIKNKWEYTYIFDIPHKNLKIIKCIDNLKHLTDIDKLYIFDALDISTKFDNSKLGEQVQERNSSNNVLNKININEIIILSLQTEQKILTYHTPYIHIVEQRTIKMREKNKNMARLLHYYYNPRNSILNRHVQRCHLRMCCK